MVSWSFDDKQSVPFKLIHDKMSFIWSEFEFLQIVKTYYCHFE
jgi:hypothetical protein